MEVIKCILSCAFYLSLGVLAVWIWDMYIGNCKENYERRWREEERRSVEESNARWYAETRAQLDREQLFREYTRGGKV